METFYALGFDVYGPLVDPGLRAAWVKRQPEAVFDPWEVEPDVVVSGLDQLAAGFASQSK